MLMPTNLLDLSASLHRDATALLKKTDLLKKLSKYGEVVLSGSYILDLMMDGDIDLFIVNEDFDKPKSVKILSELIAQGDFNGYLYYDWSQRRRAGFPQGFYLGLKTDFRGRKWKVDVWLVNKAFAPTKRLMKMVRENLDEKNKKEILRLKYQAKIKNSGQRSSEIYRQVLGK